MAKLLVVALVLFGLFKVISLFQYEKETRVAVKESKPFVIVIPSYNNSAYCERNLRSVFDQIYDNYRVIYIDDASTDDTFDKVSLLVQSLHQEKRVQLIRNADNRGALANLYHAIHSCNNDEIVVTLDGDDFLAHENVLNKLNRAYANPDTWMTYGNFVDYPTYTQKPVLCKKVPSYIVNNNSFRKHEWMTSHLRTFYAGLFKKIKLHHLLYNGRFFPMAWDLSLMLPMLEMSGKHAVFIKDILYLYNRTNPINDHKVNIKLQSDCATYARKLTAYSRLKQLDLRPQKDAKADLVIFTEETSRLQAFLESLSLYAKNIDSVFILSRNNLGPIATSPPQTYFINYSDQPGENFREVLLNTLFTLSQNRHLFFATTQTDFTYPVDFSSCIHALNKSGGYGFYFGYSENSPECISLDTHCGAWQFMTGSGNWKSSNRLDMVLYPKETLKRYLSPLPFHDLETLHTAWTSKQKSRKVGLCHIDHD